MFLLTLISWVNEQQASEGVTPGEDVYVVLRLDGRVRKSGRVSYCHLTLTPCVFLFLWLKFQVDFVRSGELGLSGEYDFFSFIKTMSISWHVSNTLYFTTIFCILTGTTTF